MAPHETPTASTTNRPLPNSAVEGLAWPAIPGNIDSRILAVAYQLDRTQWWSPQRLEAWQMRQAERLVDHARRTVPYYAERLPSFGAGTMGIEDFRRLPILRRVDVQEHAAALHSRELPRDHGAVGEVRTSGSTGRPVTVKNTTVTQVNFMAMTLRYHQWHARDFNGITASIRLLSPHHAKLAEAGSSTPWVPGHGTGQMFYFPISKPVAEQLAWLNDLDPHYLVTTPSNLMGLIRHSNESGVRPPANLRHVVTMGEVVDPEMRRACRESWGVPLVDSYSTQEVGLIAPQCPTADHYHVNAEHTLLEVLDADGNPCEPGVVGRMVVTDLHNFAMPLIRYEVGDYAETGPPCACGRCLPVVRRVLGRTRNMLVLPDGGELWPGFGLKRMGQIDAIRQFQMIQRDIRRVDVNLVTLRPLTEAEAAAVRDSVGSRLPDGFEVRLVFVERIERSASGKFEDFISEVRR